MLDQAIKYADLGYAVFPCAPNAKRPACENGLLDATTDVEQIEAWWERWPDANVAIRTDGLVVLDLDPIDGRPNPWISDQPERYIDLAIAPLSQTPRGGRHYFFRQPVGRPVKCSQSKVAPKVDVRAEGGYVLVAPSVVAGKPYSWPIGELDCPPHKLPEPPAWLLDLLDPPTKLESVRAEVAAPSNKIPSGQRNGALTSLGGAMRHYGMSQAEIAAALRRVNLDRCTPPMDDDEVDKIAWSVGRYEPDQSATAVAERHYEQDFASDDEVEAEAVSNDPGPTPKSLLFIPGFIGEFMDHVLSTAPYPSEPLAFGAALATQSLLAARKVRDPFDNRSALYIVSLADSGSGKDWPRKCAKRLLFECGLSGAVIDSIASGEGLEDFLLLQPSAILLADEFDGLMSAIKHGKDTRYEGIMAILLKLFSQVNESYTLRTKASQDGPRSVDQPSLTLHGSAVPGRFFDALAARVLINGFFARLIILEAGPRGTARRPEVRELPESIRRVAEYWSNFVPGESKGNLAAFHPVPAVVPVTHDGEALFDDLQAKVDQHWQEAYSRDDQAAMAIWARCVEKARRLALNYACSVCHESPLIDAEAVRWACAFIIHQTRLMLFRASASVSENPFDERCQRLLDVLRRWRARKGDEWMPFWQLSRRLKGWTPRDYDDARNVLIGQSRIQYTTNITGGRPGEWYRLR